MATGMNTGELIEQRRIAAGLTFWQLAHQLGLNADVVRSARSYGCAGSLTSTSISFWRVADRRDLQNQPPTT
jgi:hypothetical protein